MMSLHNLTESCKLGAKIPNKTTIATHMQWNGTAPTYLSLAPVEETKLLSILVSNHTAGTPTFIHECFNIDAFALVFDIDGEPGAKTMEEILKPMFAAVREIFESGDESIFNCIIFTASSENKMSYHIHWPDLIVNKSRMKDVYNTVFKHDKTMLDFVDKQICDSLRLRMAYSDKFDKGIMGPAGRPVRYYGAYNNNGLAGKRYFPEWENDHLEMLMKAKVRRSEGTPLTPVNRRGNTIESMVLGGGEEPVDIDFAFHDKQNFAALPPEYYSPANMGPVISYLQSTYEHDNEALFEKIVTYMNNFVSIILGHPGKTVYMIRTHNREGGQQKWKYIQKSQIDFKLIFEHVKCQGLYVNPKNGDRKYMTNTVAEVWMTHPKKKCHERIIFNPNPNAPNANNLNLYQGLRITSDECAEVVAGKDYIKIIEPILVHIKEVWCDSDSELYEYVIRWLASATLKPWVKLGVSLVLVGGEGCGKSCVVSAIGKVFGTHYLHITDMEDLLGKFCSLLEDKLFLFADEAFWGGDRKLTGKLKGLVTEPQVRCEHKGFDTYYVDNYTNYIIASNNTHAVPAGEDARRWVCLGCSNKYKGNHEYFRKLNSTLKDDDYLGIKCLMYYFANDLDMKDWLPQIFKTTQLLREQKRMSMDTEDVFWDQVLNRKYIIPWDEYEYFDPCMDDRDLVRLGYGEKWNYQIMPFDKLYEFYKTEMSGVSHKNVHQIMTFQRHMKSTGLFKSIAPPIFTEKNRCLWVCVNFTHCRKVWREKYNDPNMEFEVK